MNKNKYMMVLVPVVFLLLFVLAYFKFINSENDAAKFKKEYESYNNKETKSGNTYQKLKISSNNPIVYASYDELIDVVKNKTGIIYLGFPNCPWCRTALPVLLKVAEKNKVNTIYYKNIYEDRDSYEIQEDKLVYSVDEKGNEIKGVEGYFDLMKELDDYLTEYVISYDGTEYDTNEKRIYAPTIVFVKDGKILGVHIGTVEGQESGFDKLTDEQYDELYSIFEEYILDMQSDSCEVGNSC